MQKIDAPWADGMPADSFVSTAPTYEVGRYFNLFEEDFFDASKTNDTQSMKYYYFDPTCHGYPAGTDYPLLVFLHGASNALVGKTCVNYTGAEYFASPDYQADLGGAYILVPIANEYKDEEGNL